MFFHFKSCLIFTVEGSVGHMEMQMQCILFGNYGESLNVICNKGILDDFAVHSSEV